MPNMLEKRIQDSLDYYPDLFRTRADVLNHLYCVLGNGYGWINGGIVSAMTKKEVNQHRKELGLSPLKRYSEAEKQEAFRKHKLHLTFFGFSENNPYIQEGYPLSEFSLLMTIPVNVKKCWLAGAYETIEWLLHLPSTERNDSNKKIALKIRKELDRRFPKGKP